MADHDAIGFLGADELIEGKPPGSETDPKVAAQPQPKVEEGPKEEEEVVGEEGGEVEGSKETAVVDKEPKTVPLSTFLHMVERAKTAEELNKTKGKFEEQEIQPPDPVKQPKEYAAFQSTMFQMNLLNERMNTSEEFARDKHGDELVDKARTYVLEKSEKDPDWFQKHIIGARNPYKAAIEIYNEHMEFQEFLASRKNRDGKKEGDEGKDPAQSSKSEPAATARKPAAQQVEPKPAVVVRKPRTIADAPSGDGAHAIPTGQGQAFDGFFKP